jgi:hypothetical protein
MTVTAKNLVPGKTVEASQTTIIDKFTATNYSASSVTISVHLAVFGDITANKNLVVKNKSLLPSECYTFPELVGQILNPGNFISTIASNGSAISMRVSGREIT